MLTPNRLLEVALARLALEYGTSTDLQTYPSQSLKLLEIGRLKLRFGIVEMVNTQGCHTLVFLVSSVQIDSYHSTASVFPSHTHTYIIGPSYHPHRSLLQRYLLLIRYKVEPWSRDVAQCHNFEPWLVVKFVATRPEGMPCQNPAGKSN